MGLPFTIRTFALPPGAGRGSRWNGGCLCARGSEDNRAPPGLHPRSKELQSTDELYATTSDRSLKLSTVLAWAIFTKALSMALRVASTWWPFSKFEINAWLIASVMTIQTVEAWHHGIHRDFQDVVLFGVIGGALLALSPAKAAATVAR